MDHRDYYRKLASEISNKDMRNELCALAGHVGKKNPITRRELAVSVYGKYTSGTDRKVRDIIPMLLDDCGIAIAATSSKAGYYICENDEERAAAWKYLDSSENQIHKRKTALGKARIPTQEDIRAATRQFGQVYQPSMFGGM